MKNILVPTDFSECAESAIEVALDIAKKTNAEIHFMHLLMTPVNWVELPKEEEDNFQETKKQIGLAKSKLRQLKEKAIKLGLKSKDFLVFDKGREEIDAHTQHHKHDFIVMGSNGAKGFKGMLGSNAQRVIQTSTVPVLIIKKKVKTFDIKNILFASTFEEEAIEAFKRILKFSGSMNADVQLLNVITPHNFKETDDALNDMQSFLNLSAGKGNKGRTYIYNAKTEEKGILKFSQENKIDVIVLATHGKSGFKKIFSPSITEKVINQSEIPVLSLNLKTH